MCVCVLGVAVVVCLKFVSLKYQCGSLRLQHVSHCKAVCLVDRSCYPDASVAEVFFVLRLPLSPLNDTLVATEGGKERGSSTLVNHSADPSLSLSSRSLLLHRHTRMHVFENRVAQICGLVVECCCSRVSCAGDLRITRGQKITGCVWNNHYSRLDSISSSSSPSSSSSSVTS